MEKSFILEQKSRYPDVFWEGSGDLIDTADMQGGAMTEETERVLRQHIEIQLETASQEEKKAELRKRQD